MNMYEQIRKNKNKSLFIIIAFFALVNFLGIGVGLSKFDNLAAGVITVNVITIIYMASVLTNSNKIVMSLNKAKKIKKEDNLFIWNTVENLSMVAQLPMPSIYIIDTDSPNAFATGMSKENSSIALTKGIIEKLNREELEAVISHELAHIANMDVKLSAVVISLMSALLFILDIMFYFVGDDSDSKIGTIIMILSILLVPLLGEILKLALSRNREYLADSTAINYCRNPEALISALEKISADEKPMKTSSNLYATLYFSEPTKKHIKNKERKPSIFDTHPPVAKRIERLQNM